MFCDATSNRPARLLEIARSGFVTSGGAVAMPWDDSINNAIARPAASRAQDPELSRRGRIGR